MNAYGGDPAIENQTQDDPFVPCVNFVSCSVPLEGALQHQRQCKIVAERVKPPRSDISESYPHLASFASTKIK